MAGRSRHLARRGHRARRRLRQPVRHDNAAASGGPATGQRHDHQQVLRRHGVAWRRAGGAGAADRRADAGRRALYRVAHPFRGLGLHRRQAAGCTRAIEVAIVRLTADLELHGLRAAGARRPRPLCPAGRAAGQAGRHRRARVEEYCERPEGVAGFPAVPGDPPSRKGRSAGARHLRRVPDARAARRGRRGRGPRRHPARARPAPGRDPLCRVREDDEAIRTAGRTDRADPFADEDGHGVRDPHGRDRPRSGRPARVR